MAAKQVQDMSPGAPRGVKQGGKSVLVNVNLYEEALLREASALTGLTKTAFLRSAMIEAANRVIQEHKTKQ